MTKLTYANKNIAPSAIALPRPLSPAATTLLCLALACGLGSISRGLAQTNSAAVTAAAQAFLATLSPAQSNNVVYAPTLANAWHWSNFPIYEAARSGLSMETLNATQRVAFLNVAFTALSSNGTNFYQEIRAMDEYLRVNVNPSNYSSEKYYISFVGAPVTNAPWLLQLSGHHASYNNIYNAEYVSGTPAFIGTEPNIYTNESIIHRPLSAPADAVTALRQTLTGAAQLASSYSEVVFGVTPQTGYDDSWPNVYPTTGRGQLYSNLTSNQQALVRAFMAFYVNQMPAETAASLLFDYQNPAALAQTYVGYSGPADLAIRDSYFRVDGPRVWIEFSARPGVAYSFPHWHSIWRDKLADYGAAFGSTTISTTNRPPTITSSPTSRTNEVGTSTTFAVNATGQGTLFYQWQRNGAAIADATNSTYTITSVTNADAATYRCQVWNFMGHRFSAAASLTVPTTNPPALSGAFTGPGLFQLQVAGDVGPNYMIQGSTNLTDWEALYTTNPAVMPFNWIDVNATNYPARFFRVNFNP
jgi:hypothetical protein